MPGLVMLGSRAVGWVGWMGRIGRGAGVKRHRRGAARAAGPAMALPEGLDVTHLLEAARQQFMCLQAAWDAGDLATLGALTTPEMLDELCAELPPADGPPNQTDVLSLQASLLGFDDFGSAWLATIEFSGVIREGRECAAAPFRELWLLTRSREMDDQASPAWRLARQQALL